MSRIHMRLASGLFLGVLAFAAGACDDENDPTAPADSVITVSAAPQTIVVPSVGNGEADITATVRSKNGTRLPDQEITFSTSQGELDPVAETPLQTDDQGQATSKLFTRTSATITARSGSITGTTQVQTVTCDLGQFLLSVQPMFITECNHPPLTLTATIEDVNGDPCENIRVIFSQDPNDLLTGSFTPSSQVSSDAAGLAIVTWKANFSQCDSKCTANNDPNGGICGSLYFTAGDTTGTFNSAPVPVLEDVD